MGYRQKVALVILFFALAPLVPLGTLLVVREYRARERQLLEGFRSSLDARVRAVNGVLQASYFKVFYAASNPDLHRVLSTPFEGNLQRVLASYQSLRDLFRAYTELDAYRSVLAAYAVAPGIYHGEFSQPLDRLDAGVRAAVLGSAPGEIAFSYRDGVLSVATQVLSLSNDMLGVVELTIPFQVVAELLAFPIPRGSILAYVSQDRAAVVSIHAGEAEPEGAEAVVRAALSGAPSRRYAALLQELQYQDGLFALLVPRRYVVEQLTVFIVGAILAVAAIIVAVVLSVSVTSAKISQRLRTLVGLADSDIAHLVEGKPVPLLEGNDEFGRIDRLFVGLVERIREYYRRLAESEEGRRTLELALLQERINPHLLYNTLSSITWAFPDERLRRVIDAMVRYYRTVLARGSETVTIGEEMTLLRQYVMIQRFAYRSEFGYDAVVEDGLEGTLIPKLLLQPFVENAILHGINGLESGGRVRVCVCRTEGRIRFEVQDNGVGMDQEKADAVVRGDPDASRGYGIRNVVRRLGLAYGDGFEVRIRSSTNGGTKVEISIPHV